MILLTFNVRNHDAPLKKGFALNDAERLEITVANTRAILRILDIHEIKSSFFIEISLVESVEDLIRNISARGHEIALYQEKSTIAEMQSAKLLVEEFLGKQIRGLRQKEQNTDIHALKMLGFSYISNIDFADILFPLKRLARNCEISEQNGISIIPESISPYSQIPYNDFAFQIVPMTYYENMVFETLKNEDFVLIYLETWQFTDMEKHPFKIPFYRKYNSGKKMEDRLEKLLQWINEKELATSRMKDYIF